MAASTGFKIENIREEIEIYLAQNGLKPGDALPSERFFSEILHANRAAVHHAFLHLEGEHLIMKKGGLKYYLTGPKYTDDATLSGSFTAQYAAKGLVPGALVYSFELKEADLKTSRHLSVRPGTPVYELKRVRTINGQPIMIDISYLVSNICPDLLNYDFSGQNSLYATLDTVYGLKLTRHQQDIRTTTLTEEEAVLLDARTGNPAFYAIGLSLTPEGRPIERSITITRADRMSITYSALVENNLV